MVIEDEDRVTLAFDRTAAPSGNLPWKRRILTESKLRGWAEAGSGNGGHHQKTAKVSFIIRC